MARTSLDKNRIGFLLLENVHESAVAELAAAGWAALATAEVHRGDVTD